MAELPNLLRERIVAGKNLLVAEVSPPPSGDPGPLRAAAASYAGKIHALGIGGQDHRVDLHPPVLLGQSNHQRLLDLRP